MIKPEDVAAPMVAKRKQDVHDNLERWIDLRLTQGIFQVPLAPLGISYTDKDIIDKIIKDYEKNGWRIDGIHFYSFCWQTVLTFTKK